jgi:NADH-ubiquinone oxidoreductase chain 4L
MLNAAFSSSLMSLSHLLFVVGVLGFALNRRNLILALLSIEIMLLAVSLLVLMASLNLDDATGQTYAVLVVAIAGAESAVGLGILVAYYRLRGTVDLTGK